MLFMIIGSGAKGDPLFEAELGAQSTSESDLAYLHQFILHSSLDMIQSAMWTNGATFLRTVDRFNSLLVSAYATPGGAILLLLHQGKAEDPVRQFFTEAHDLYTKHMLNPFASFDKPITSRSFDDSIRNSAKRCGLLS